MLLDDETDYSPDDLERAVEPVDPENPWRDGGGEVDESGSAGESDAGSETDADSPGDTDDDTGPDRSGSLSDFSE